MDLALACFFLCSIQMILSAVCQTQQRRVGIGESDVSESPLQAGVTITRFFGTGWYAGDHVELLRKHPLASGHAAGCGRVA